MQKRVKFLKNPAAFIGADALRKIADCLVGTRQGCVAQEQARREPFDGTAYHRVGVLRQRLIAKTGTGLRNRSCSQKARAGLVPSEPIRLWANGRRG